MVKMWIDDERPPPDDTWDVWCRDSIEALTFLRHNEQLVSEISFDVDMGSGKTTIPVAQDVQAMAQTGRVPPIFWYIHEQEITKSLIELKKILDSADRAWFDGLDDED